MLLRSLTILAVLAYNGILAMGLWQWDWPVGVVFVLLIAEILVIGLHQMLELVRAGAELGHPLRAVAIGLPGVLAMAAVAAVAAGFAAYYSWITGIEISSEYLLWPLVALAGRYLLELGVSLFMPEPGAPSVLLHRFWVRALTIALGVLVCGVPLLLFIMSTFPFEMPDPGRHLFQLGPYLDGIEPLIDRVVSAATLTLVVVIKFGIEVYGIWVGSLRTEARPWIWVDRLLGVKPATVEESDLL